MPRRPTILLVEDEPLLQGLYRDLLRRVRAKLFVAGEERSAVATARRVKPDLILLDLLIPSRVRTPSVSAFHEPVGYHVLRALARLREAHPCRIIVLSNLDEDEHRQRCLGLGADATWVKANLPPDEFVRRVRQTLVF